jgi:hypothetical protein
MTTDTSGGGVHKRRPSYRGVSYSRVVAGQEIQVKWPKGRGRSIHPKTKIQMEFFRQTQWAFKFMDPLAQQSYATAVAGTPLMPRDLYLMATSGRMHAFLRPDGTRIYPMAGIKSVSESLDFIAQTPGSMLLRGTEQWEGIPGVNFARRDEANDFDGDVAITGTLTVSGGATHLDGGFRNYMGGDVAIQPATDYYPSFNFLNEAGDVRASYYGGTNGDPTFYVDAEEIWLENLAENKVFVKARHDFVKLLYENAVKLVTTADGVTITGYANCSTGVKVGGTQVIGAQQAAIANDASGAPNQAKVNAILAVLRTHGIIAT